MEVKTFEAYTYKGPDLMELNREEFIEQLIDNLTDCEIGGYQCNGTGYYSKKNELWLHLDKRDKNGNYNSYKIAKLDLSNIGIEIGNAEWNDEKEYFEEFIPELNLDTDIVKQVKDFRKNINNYNL